LIDEVGNEVPGGVEDALHVDGEDFVEFVFGDIDGWLFGCQYGLL